MTYNIDIDDYIGRWGYSKQYVQNKLSSCKDKEISVRISSFGGELNHGLNIRQLFLDHGNVTAYIHGYAASAATVVAMGCKKVCISKYAFFLVHKVSNWVDQWGTLNADELQAVIEKLEKNKQENEKMDLALAQMYAERCNKSVADVAEILKKGAWLNAQEALDFGFVDEIIEEGTKLNFDDAMQTKFNYLGLPDLPVTPGSPAVKEAKGDGPAIISAIKTGFATLQNAISGKKENTETEPPVKITTMNKKFERVNALLKIDGVEVAEGKANLTEEQLQALNDRLNVLEKEVKDKQDLITEKDTQIENLNKQGADDTPPADDGASNEENPYKDAKAIYDRV